MEYDSSFPHHQYTVGFAGKGGINSIMINLQDNSAGHGPGEDSKQEPHTVFGTVVQGKEFIDLMSQQPVSGQDPFGFVHNRADFIYIREVKLPQSKANGEYISTPPQCMIDYITKKLSAEPTTTSAATTITDSTSTATTALS